MRDNPRTTTYSIAEGILHNEGVRQPTRGQIDLVKSRLDEIVENLDADPLHEGLLGSMPAIVADSYIVKRDAGFYDIEHIALAVAE